MTAPSFVKVDTPQVAFEEADLGPEVTRLEFDLEFQQKKGAGIGAFFRDKYKPADPDLCVVAFSGITPVDYVEPKQHRLIFDGAAQNLGDAKGNGIETVVIDVAQLAHRNRDITGFAVAASCPDGFGRVAGVVCHVYDTSVTGRREHIAPCRFDLTKPNITSGLFGGLVFVEGTWRFRKFNSYSTGNGWQDIATSARSYMAP